MNPLNMQNIKAEMYGRNGVSLPPRMHKGNTMLLKPIFSSMVDQLIDYRAFYSKTFECNELLIQ